MDARYLTTPLGAAVGIALSRAAIDKEDRTLFNQGVGAAAGAGIGYIGGGYLNEATQPKDRASRYARFKKDFLSKGPDYRHDEDMSDSQFEDIAEIVGKGSYKPLPNADSSKATAAYNDSLRWDYVAKQADALRAAIARQQGNDAQADWYLKRSNNTASRIQSRNSVANKLLSYLPSYLTGGESR
jgi:hypothetical protein